MTHRREVDEKRNCHHFPIGVHIDPFPTATIPFADELDDEAAGTTGLTDIASRVAAHSNASTAGNRADSDRVAALAVALILLWNMI